MDFGKIFLFALVATLVIVCCCADPLPLASPDVDESGIPANVHNLRVRAGRYYPYYGGYYPHYGGGHYGRSGAQAQAQSQSQSLGGGIYGK